MGGGGASLRGLPPARASERKRTSKSSCKRPFSDRLPDRLPELCSSSLQATATRVRRRRYEHEMVSQCTPHFCLLHQFSQMHANSLGHSSAIKSDVNGDDLGDSQVYSCPSMHNTFGIATYTHLHCKSHV